MKKGKASWATRKTALGWVIDSLTKTLEMPPHRTERLQKIFDNLRDQKRARTQTVGARPWQALLCVGSHPFGPLQLVLSHAKAGRVRITASVRDNLTKFEWLVRDIANRPTRLGEIVPNEPVVIGTTDACKFGMGGTLFAHDEAPVLWRSPFPADVSDRVASYDNPQGDVTNSDLEQAALIAQGDVAAAIHRLTGPLFCPSITSLERDSF